MTEAELWAAWRLWMIVAAIIIVVAAALLVTIWLTARSIRAHAVRALNAAEAIRRHTLPIWELQTSNEVAEGLLATVQSIEQKSTQLVEALETPAGAGGRAGNRE
jgi:hypothetical protein